MTNKSDTSRIPLILDLLEQRWKEHPDWRFGQLISNIFDHGGIDSLDVFYISDLKSMSLLENFR